MTTAANPSWKDEFAVVMRILIVTSEFLFVVTDAISTLFKYFKLFHLNPPRAGFRLAGKLNHALARSSPLSQIF
jgi:hypothetical protein